MEGHRAAQRSHPRRRTEQAAELEGGGRTRITRLPARTDAYGNQLPIAYSKGHNSPKLPKASTLNHARRARSRSPHELWPLNGSCCASC
jgi:hypothetical protein